MPFQSTATRSLQAAHGSPSDGQEEKKKEGRLNKSVGEINTFPRYILHEGFCLALISKLGLGLGSHGYGVVSGCARMIWFCNFGRLVFVLSDALWS